VNAAVALVVASLVGVLAQWMRLARRWGIGAPAGVDLALGLRTLPRAYFEAVHRVVARERRVARMHVLTAGGTLWAVAFVLLQAIWPSRVLAGLAVAAAACACVGAVIDQQRRSQGRPARLSGGAYDRLPFALGGFNTALGALALQDMVPVRWPGALAVTLTALGAVCVATLIAMAARGPMRHALAGVVHLVAHPRPRRFAPGVHADTALAPLDLEADKLGAETIADFSWNRLAAFDSCVQCGKCEEACPAFAAEQPLNPKKLINDLTAAPGGIGSDYWGNPHPGVSNASNSDPLDPLVGPAGRSAVAPETIWSCTTCRACVEACPMLIEHVDAVVDLRRFLVLETGDVPAKVAKTLTALRETDTVSGRATSSRFDWAVDLDLPVLGEARSCEVLLWAGDSAFDLRNQRTLRSLVLLLRHAGIDVAVLGPEERDCGDLARRLGDEATFQGLAKANLETLSRYSFDRIVTADPHVAHCLAKEYAAFAPPLPVVHHTTFLEELVAVGRLPIRRVPRSEIATFHDPCYLGRYSGEIEAPRRLLTRMGLALKEMERHAMNSRCCGGGGGAPIADVPGKRRISDLRVDDARAAGAATIVAACPYCTQMLEGVIGPRPEIVDIAELLLTATEGRP
jgi:Fe-S oxidoreductase